MPPGPRRLAAVATITIGLSMAVLSNSMTNLALPYIANVLAITAESSIWIVNAYQIALMIMLLPIAALGDIVGYRTVYRWGLVTTHAKRPFDVLSAVLSGGMFGLLIFGIDGVGHGHPLPVILAELVGSALLCTLFVWRQRSLAEPMMPIDVFARPIFSLSISASTCTFAAQGLAFVSLPFFFHTVLGRDATATGLLLTAWPLALAGVAPIAGRLADRHHAGALGAIGLTCMASGLILTALLPPDPSAANIMWRLVLCGAGFGIFASPNNRLMMNAVPRDRSGSAGGIIASARTLGQTMGAALVSLVFGLFDFSGGGAADAARAAIWLAAGFALTAMIVSSLRLRH